MSLPIPSEIIDDDRLVQAFREIFGQSVTFDMEAEIKKATKVLYPDDYCHRCGAPGEYPTCYSCRMEYRREEAEERREE